MYKHISTQNMTIADSMISLHLFEKTSFQNFQAEVYYDKTSKKYVSYLNILLVADFTHMRIWTGSSLFYSKMGQTWPDYHIDLL